VTASAEVLGTAYVNSDEAEAGAVLETLTGVAIAGPAEEEVVVGTGVVPIYPLGEDATGSISMKISEHCAPWLTS